MTFCRAKQPNKGFTLIEVMVVLVIVSLMVGLIVFGFDQALNRRKGAAAEEIYQWLQAAADTAVFQSTVVGVAQKEEQLMLLAFYQDDWYRLADQEDLVLDEEITLAWSESLIQSSRFQDSEFQNGRVNRDNEDRPRPYVVIMPSGEVLPEGQINIFDRTLDDDSLQNSEQTLATIRWDEDQHFDLYWQIEQ